MQRRRAEAIWIESRKRWQCNVMREGIRKTFTCSKPGKVGKHECEAIADRWLDTFETEQKYHTALDCYLADKREQVQSSTFNVMQATFNKYIYPAFPPAKRLGAITIYDWQRWLDNVCRNNELRESSLKQLILHIVTFNNYCISRRWAVTPIKGDMFQISYAIRQKKTKNALTTNELQRLLNADADAVPYVAFYQMLVLTGLRKGEMLGLRWEDIHDGAIYVNRNVIGNEVHEGKTENARRKVPLTEQAAQILNAHKARLLRLNCLNVSSVFVDESTGRMLCYGSLNRRWAKVCEMLQLENYTIHELRHTFISMTQSDVSEVILKQVVGHSASMDTYGVYGHQTDKDMDTARSAISKTFENLIDK